MGLDLGEEVGVLFVGVGESTGDVEGARMIELGIKT